MAYFSLSTLDGVREAAAIKSQALASSGIRLANNLEIGVEVCNILIQQFKNSLQVAQACELPENGSDKSQHGAHEQHSL